MSIKPKNNKESVASSAEHWMPGRRVGEHTHKILVTLWAIFLVYLIFFVGTLIRNNLQEYDYIGQADKVERTIRIEAEGKVTASPDVAETTIGMSAGGETVAVAQEKNTSVMNKLIARLKELGVSDKDIQTANYNIYPKYNYPEDKDRELDGYEVSQNVTVKIRNLEKANEIIALAGEVGANSVSGLSFTLDDRENYKSEAREKALEKIAEKANALSRTLGVKFVGIVTYDEFESMGKGPYPYYEARAMDSGLGGGAPDIESGSTDVILNVNVVFEIR